MLRTSVTAVTSTIKAASYGLEAAGLSNLEPARVFEPYWLPVRGGW
jgi:hypothetical protein